MNILVVESKAKSKTIQKYLGKDWTVLATGGHVQELPDRKNDPDEGKKAYWSNRPGELPNPPWAWTDNGEKAVSAIIDAAKSDGTPRFFLATDPDREGEFIAWRLTELLSPLGQTARVTFQEVTKDAILEALANPREVDMDLVRSAMVRRFLDRLVGFRTSKMARSYVTKATASMGRVQTPTLGFVVDRELEREAHVAVKYLEVGAAAEGVDLEVRFHESSDPHKWTDEDGKFMATRTSDAPLAEGAHEALEAVGHVTIAEARPSEQSQAPKPPFTTDALLQAAGGRWGWSPKKTSKLASDLYEAGHITYIRTDSTRLSDEAVGAARAAITAAWGADQVGEGAKGKAGAGKVQDAHEAIRPTRLELAAPPDVEDDTRRLYQLIRAQVLASQMVNARQARLQITARADGLDLPLVGSVSWYVALGWRAAFQGIDAAPSTRPPRGLETGARLALLPGTSEAPNPYLKRGETQPPPRYRAHSLIKAMKEAGIGRPSTYATTVETLVDRGYVTDDGGALVPTEDGRRVWREVAPMYALPAKDPLFDVAYTAAMETRLDEVAEGTEPAPKAWEELRDAVKEAHEFAQNLRRTGNLTPAQRQSLVAVLENAPAELIVGVNIDALSWADASALMTRLREAGVSPAPSERQRAEVARLVGKLGLDAAAAALLVGLETLDQLRTNTQASTLIDALRAQVSEVSAVSDKQLRFVQDLAKKAGLSEADACGRVGATRFDELTDGREGTASQLITLLKRERRPGGAAKTT